MARATRLLTATLAAAAAVIVPGETAASADGLDPSTAYGAYSDTPFHYAKGDHLTGTEEYPTSSRYGYGRPVFLIGDSMAAQLADGLLQVTKADGRALLPRTKSAAKFQLPGPDTDDGRWSTRVRAQVLDEATAGRKPIVLLVGQRLGTTDDIRRTVWRLRADGAIVYLSTASPRPKDVSSIPRCVVAASRPNTTCRYTLEHWGVGRATTITAARYAHPQIAVLDMKPLVARGSGPTYAPVHTGVDGPVQVYRGVGSHITATWSREVLKKALATFLG